MQVPTQQTHRSATIHENQHPKGLVGGEWQPVQSRLKLENCDRLPSWEQSQKRRAKQNKTKTFLFPDRQFKKEDDEEEDEEGGEVC